MKGGDNMAKPLVSNLAMTFKRATTITEDVTEAKKEHRRNLKNLVDKYFEDVTTNKADGIRTAKELVEVIKLDLLLMGEATERTDSTNPIDEVQVTKLSQALDTDSPEVQSLLENMFKALNEANDSMDMSHSDISQPATNVEGDGDSGVSIPQSNPSVPEGQQ
jgi:uncharacterized phage protein gp47/JayE